MKTIRASSVCSKAPAKRWCAFAMNPGTLLLFEGRNSIHRVTPIAGQTTRLVALLAYDTKPGTRSSKGLQMARYGRTA